MFIGYDNILQVKDEIRYMWILKMEHDQMQNKNQESLPLPNGQKKKKKKKKPKPIIICERQG